MWYWPTLVDLTTSLIDRLYVGLVKQGVVTGKSSIPSFSKWGGLWQFIRNNYVIQRSIDVIPVKCKVQVLTLDIILHCGHSLESRRRCSCARVFCIVTKGKDACLCRVLDVIFSIVFKVRGSRWIVSGATTWLVWLVSPPWGYLECIIRFCSEWKIHLVRVKNFFFVWSIPFICGLVCFFSRKTWCQRPAWTTEPNENEDDLFSFSHATGFYENLIFGWIFIK